MKPTITAVLSAAMLLTYTPIVRADDAAKVFEERIVPIFKSPNPSSCTRCHLASVDLKDYILPSAKDTFLALREQGLIDLEKNTPRSSKPQAWGASQPASRAPFKIQ